MGIDRLIEIAREAVGLTALDPAFADWIARGETPERRAEFMRYAATPGTSFSTCGLFLRGALARWLEEQGRHVPQSIAAPYRAPWEDQRYGGAVADVREAIRGAGALLVGTWGRRAVDAVDPGALLVVGEGRATHILLVERVHDDYPGEVRYDAIEGGLVCQKTGAQRIGRRRHTIDSSGRDKAGGHRDDAGEWVPLGLARRVQWILNPGTLAP